MIKDIKSKHLTDRSTSLPHIKPLLNNNNNDSPQSGRTTKLPFFPMKSNNNWQGHSIGDRESIKKNF